MPIGHDLDKAAFADKIRLHDGRKLANAAARQQSWRKPGEIVHGDIRLKGQRLLVLSVLVNEGPAAVRLPMRERQEPMVEAGPEVSGAARSP